MKKMLLGLLVLTSLSVFAQDKGLEYSALDLSTESQRSRLFKQMTSSEKVGDQKGIINSALNFIGYDDFDCYKMKSYGRKERVNSENIKGLIIDGLTNGMIYSADYHPYFLILNFAETYGPVIREYVMDAKVRILDGTGYLVTELTLYMSEMGIEESPYKCFNSLIK